jgi:hypothetical protein
MHISTGSPQSRILCFQQINLGLLAIQPLFMECHGTLIPIFFTLVNQKLFAPFDSFGRYNEDVGPSIDKQNRLFQQALPRAH